MTDFILGFLVGTAVTIIVKFLLNLYWEYQMWTGG
jgi:hypothetical protein